MRLQKLFQSPIFLFFLESAQKYQIPKLKIHGNVADKLQKILSIISPSHTHFDPDRFQQPISIIHSHTMYTTSPPLMVRNSTTRTPNSQSRIFGIMTMRKAYPNPLSNGVLSPHMVHFMKNVNNFN